MNPQRFFNLNQYSSNNFNLKFQTVKNFIKENIIGDKFVLIGGGIIILIVLGNIISTILTTKQPVSQTPSDSTSDQTPISPTPETDNSSLPFNQNTNLIISPTLIPVTPTFTPTPTSTPTPTPSLTPLPSPTPTISITASPTPEATTSATPTP